jgi:hypothetical protein
MICISARILHGFLCFPLTGLRVRDQRSPNTDYSTEGRGAQRKKKMMIIVAVARLMLLASPAVAFAAVVVKKQHNYLGLPPTKSSFLTPLLLCNSPSSSSDDKDDESSSINESTEMLLVESSSNYSDGSGTILLPPCIISPVLAQVYPAIVEYKQKHGTANIPLGSTNGKRCKTLRRLHYQNLLTNDETELLSSLGFIFHTFEDVYAQCDFDEMLFKLTLYHKEHRTYQIPKKYDRDPELGAWATMCRRLYQKQRLPQDRIDKLDAIDFEWTSSRKCGSAFMSQYRLVLSYLNKVVEVGGNVDELIPENEYYNNDGYEDDTSEMRKWISLQRTAHEKGLLSDSRVQYMDELPGIDWRNPSSWA